NNPGNVSGVRWCTGTLITQNLFLTAGHCFDRTAGNWRLPRINGTNDVISSADIAANMHVNFNYQVDPAGNPRPVESFTIEELVEHRLGGLDFAIVRLSGSPSQTYGQGIVALEDPNPNDMLCIIGHPAGVPKRIEAGPLTSVSGDRLRYNDIDTLGGNSGSAIMHSPTGVIVGVHTNGGCNSSGTGANSGMRIGRLLEESPTLRKLLVRRVINNFGYDAGGWRVDRHPRFLADLTGNGRADIVGFGNAGVYVARNNGNGTFQAVQLVVNNFGHDAGGWRVDSHPRLLADVTGNGRVDIVGFGDAAVYVARNNGDGTFQPVQRVINNFCYNAGGWRIDSHPRLLADVTGNGRADIVGFGDAGVYVARNNGDGTFQPAQLVVNNFGYSAGGWRVDSHPRMLADLTGDGRADIVGFGDAGVYVARNNGDGTFQAVQLVVNNFGYSAGWRVDRHPRFLADVMGNGLPDIVGFGNAGVYVAANNGDGTFQPVQLVVNNFGYNAGGWRVDRHPRFLANVLGNGRADIVGFGDAGVYVAANNGNGTFQPLQRVVDNFGYGAGGWRVDRHPRFLANV
ncbi:MAG: FG-GAP-like repeat-containing protein, partial [Thermoanaerobaculia bacterium]